MTDEQDPSQPSEADTLLTVDLAEHGMPGEIERLWARRVAEHRFVLCSVPLFAYGMTTGDEVQVDNELRIKKVTESSGNLTLRMFVDPENAEPFRARVESLLSQLGLQHEWQGDGYVAAVLSPAGIPVEVLTMLEEWPSETRPQWELV